MVDQSYPPPTPMMPPQAPPPAPMSATMEAPPIGAAATAPAPPQPNYAAGDALIAGMGDPLSQTNAFMVRQRSALAAPERAVQQAGREYQQAAAGAPKLPQQAAPEPQQGMGLEAAGSWVMVATALGAIAGAMTRRSTTNALAAFTGALEGAQQGNKQAFEQNKTIWEQENKRINQQLQQQRDAYLDILNSKKINFDMKMLELQQEAQRQHDDMMAQQAARRDMITIAGMLDKREELRVRGVEDYQKMDNALRVAEIRASGGGQISDETAKRLATQLDAGQPESRILSHLNRSDAARVRSFQTKSAEQLGEAQQDYTRGQSAARTGGTIEERVNYATNELKSAIPLALESSNNLPRGQFVPINKIVQMGQAATSNPQYNDFILKTNALAKAYGRAMNPQGVPRVSENKEAEAKGILSTAISREAYETQAKALWQEATNAQRAALATRPGAAPLPSPFDAGGGAQAKPSGGMDLGGGWSVR